MLSPNKIIEGAFMRWSRRDCSSTTQRGLYVQRKMA